MAKKNLPNIPIYIGDWERDCNVLSLESEAAWMRIVFKLWTKGKQNTIKIPTKSLQNLWRCSEEKMNEILEDLIFNEIAEITVNSSSVEFTCRRFVKENEISKIRSRAAKGEKKESKKKAKPKQTSNKNEQNTEIENDYVNEIEVKDEIEIGGSRGNFSEMICEYFLQTREHQKMKVSGFLRSLGDDLENFKQQTLAYAQYKELTGEKIHNWLSYQTEWDREDWQKKLEREIKQNGKQNTDNGATDEFRKKTAARLGITIP